MQKIVQKILTGERALFSGENLEIVDSIFEDGESPLKESKNIVVRDSGFKWKYPLWYANNIEVFNSTFFETARSGIWYTHNIKIVDSIIWAPKTFRRASKIKLENVMMPNAQETFWNCEDITLDNVNAKGDYFGMNSSGLVINNLNLCGNYCFDGGKNIEIHHSKLISKDSFWNCENVVVYDSIISGEYLGWNSKNIKFVNCTIESLQGMCYMDNLVMENCKLINTTRSFEYSTVEANITNHIDSVCNPKSGVIKALSIGELELDERYIDPKKTEIITEE